MWGMVVWSVLSSPSLSSTASIVVVRRFGLLLLELILH